MTVCSNGYPSEYIFGDITMSTSVLGDRFCLLPNQEQQGTEKKWETKKKEKKKDPSVHLVYVLLIFFRRIQNYSKCRIFREAFNNISISRSFQQWNRVRSWNRDYNC